jgi:hypothetical protein
LHDQQQPGRAVLLLDERECGASTDRVLAHSSLVHRGRLGGRRPRRGICLIAIATIVERGPIGRVASSSVSSSWPRSLIDWHSERLTQPRRESEVDDIPIG